MIVTLTDVEYRSYMNALDYVAEFETDGIYTCGGKRPRHITSMIEKGALIEVAANRFEPVA